MDDEGLLLTEFNHRLFNTLQMIWSYLSLCSRAASLQDARKMLSEFDDRIRSLAALHDLLATPIEGHLEDECRSIALLLLKSFGREDVVPRIRMEDLPLDDGQRLRVALLVVELLTNVLKHSLVGDCGGTVWVDLRLNRGWVELTVCDSRKQPAPSEPPSRIVSALARGLSGEAQVVDHDGYTACVRFPLLQPDPAGAWIRCPVELSEQRGG